MAIDDEADASEVVSGMTVKGVADSSVLGDTESGQGLHNGQRCHDAGCDHTRRGYSSAADASTGTHIIVIATDTAAELATVAMVDVLSGGASGGKEVESSVVTALPPPVTSLSDLAFLFSCGVGQPKNFDAAEDDEQNIEMKQAEASASSSPGTIVGTVRRAKAGGHRGSEPCGSAGAGEPKKSQLAIRMDAPVIKTF